MIARNLLLSSSLLLAAACGGGKNGGTPADAGVDGGPPDASCFDNPTTYNEIINACTTAVKVYKDSHPALLRPDGSLPPLP